MTRVKETLNLVYHGIKTSERPELFADVRSWLAEMDDTQPAEDERVKDASELRTLLYQAGNEILSRTDVDYGLRLLSRLLPVQPAQTVDLSLLPYEIAEELPKIGGGFGELATMCKSHVAALVEKLINARTVHPAQHAQNANEQGLIDVYRENLCRDAKCEGARFSAAQAVLKGGLVHREIADAVSRYCGERSEEVTATDLNVHPAASTEAQNERKHDE